jgi:predicted secreted Zn-dependent protease
MTLLFLLLSCVRPPTLEAAPPGCAPYPVSRSTYPVTGATHEALRDSVAANGPGDGRVGLTTTTLDWACTNRNGVLTIRADVTIDVLLPKWTPPRDADAQLRADYERWIEVQDVHELGHVDISQRGLGCLAERARSFATCAEVKVFVEKALADTEAAQDAYDRKTDHGIKQGAVL